ncbi:hypothetical protein LTR54_000583 [Friedmanniomyces endolithicus]|nr:hypothetical protein LTR54_000583 [Friedmanniomyces endolithicus]
MAIGRQHHRCRRRSPHRLPPKPGKDLWQVNHSPAPQTKQLGERALNARTGEVFSLTLFGKKRIFISSQKLMEEICDEKRFGKLVSAALGELRNGIHDGLFTAQNDEENWGLAHRILVPAFGPLNITGMFDDMKDIASQLVLKWARYGSDYVIPTTDDFTRLTLDTLALCAMNYRFVLSRRLVVKR